MTSAHYHITFSLPSFVPNMLHLVLQYHSPPVRPPPHHTGMAKLEQLSEDRLVKNVYTRRRSKGMQTIRANTMKRWQDNVSQ